MVPDPINREGFLTSQHSHMALISSRQSLSTISLWIPNDSAKSIASLRERASARRGEVAGKILWAHYGKVGQLPAILSWPGFKEFRHSSPKFNTVFHIAHDSWHFLHTHSNTMSEMGSIKKPRNCTVTVTQPYRRETRRLYPVEIIGKLRGKYYFLSRTRQIALLKTT